MSKFTELAVTSHTLSLAAMEEASRCGQRTTDIDHMLLALTVTEQRAGHVLRGLGITLAATRAAVAAQHDAQLAAIGVQAPRPEAGRIVFHETDGYEWSERALDVINRASKGEGSGDASAVLRELVAEPSGLVADLLVRLDSSPARVLARLDEDSLADMRAVPRPRTDALTGTSRAFAPAPPEQVWELLADPARLPEWDERVAFVQADAARGRPRAGECWSALAPRVSPDGKPLRVRPKWRRLSVELLALEPQTTVAWRLTFPDVDRANARIVRIALSPDAGGTTVDLTLSYERHPDRAGSVRRLLGSALSPLYRVNLWIQLSQLGSGISRVFR